MISDPQMRHISSHCPRPNSLALRRWCGPKDVHKNQKYFNVKRAWGCFSPTEKYWIGIIDISPPFVYPASFFPQVISAIYEIPANTLLPFIFLLNLPVSSLTLCTFSSHLCFQQWCWKCFNPPHPQSPLSWLFQHSAAGIFVPPRVRTCLVQAEPPVWSRLWVRQKWVAFLFV